MKSPHLKPHESTLTFLATIGLGLFAPWWIVLVPGLVLGLFFGDGRSRLAFYSSVIAGSAWFTMAVIRDIATGARLSARVAAAMNLPHSSLLYIFTFVIAAVLAGFACALGQSIRALLSTTRENANSKNTSA